MAFTWLPEFFAVLLRQPDFTVRLEDGRARLWQGQAPQAFVKECAEIAAQRELSRGLIFGCRRGRGLVLEFRGVPESCHQRFRNVWQIHRGRD